MDTLAIASTHAVATPPASVERGGAAAQAEPEVERWPGWVRLMVLVGGSAALWAGIAWAAVRVLKLG